jgi:phage N-6-adenine-methyltransferase
MNRVVLSSDRMDWATPRAFFAEMHREFGFDIDVCADSENACLPTYWTEQDDALSKVWTGVCWMNPPFGHGIGKWVRKAFEASRSGAVVVCLLPARVDTSWWHDYVKHATEIRFIRGRMRFSGHSVNAPFPCALVVFDRHEDSGKVTYMDRILDSAA